MKKIISLILSTALALCILSPVAAADNLVSVTVDGYQFAAASVISEYAGVEEKILEAFDNLQENIDLSNYRIPVADISGIFMGTLFDNPEYFYVPSSFSYSYNQFSGRVSRITVTYSADAETIMSQKNELEAAVEKALSGMNDEMSEVEKVLYIHDYLSLSVSYDFDSLELSPAPVTVFSAYGALVNQSAVCQGYALAFTLLSKRVGIESCFVSSNAMNHGWNAVKVDGNWYHIDATQDDTNMSYRGNIITYSGTSHSKFLLSDAQISEAGYNNWEYISVKHDPNPVNEYSGNKLWDGVTSTMFYEDGLWYSRDRDTIFSAGINGENGTVVCRIDDVSAYSQIYVDGILVFYNTSSGVYLYNRVTEDLQTILTVLDNQQIVGLSVDGADVIYETVDTGGNYQKHIYNMSDAVAAAAVEEMIFKIPPITSLEQKPIVEAARAAYNELALAQKTLVSNLSTLEEWEAVIRVLERPSTDLPGDVNNDGILTVSDVVMLRMFVMNGQFNANGDLNGDDVLSVNDVVVLRSIIMRAGE